MTPPQSALRAVLRAFVDSVWDAERRPTRTRLMKLAYLFDLGYAQTHGGHTWTGFEWRFHHFGPYARALQAVLDAMDGVDADEEQHAHGDRPYSVYGGAHGARWDAELERVLGRPERTTLNSVMQQWAGAELNALLDYVYFETAPMATAKRGDVLDFSIPQHELFLRRVPHNPILSPEFLARLRARLASAPAPSPGVPLTSLTRPLGEREERLLRRAEGGRYSAPQGVVDISVGRQV